MNLLPQRRRLRSEFVKYAIISAVPAVGVGHLFFYMWTNGVYRELADFTTLVPVLPGNEAGVEAIVMFGAGLYLTWLFLFRSSYGKKYQGNLLFLMSALVVGVLWVFGIGVPNIDPTLSNALSIVLGVLTGLITEFSTVMTINSSKSDLLSIVDDNGDAIDFSIAQVGVLALIGFIILSSNVFSWFFVGTTSTTEVLFSGAHLLFSVWFLVALNLFVQLSIEEEENAKIMEVVGPQQSGKTYSALGLWITAQNSGRFKAQRTMDDLDALVEAYQETIPAPKDRGKQNGLLDWDIMGNKRDEVNELGMVIIPMDAIKISRIDINMLDHAGELLEDIAATFGYDPTETVQVRSDGGTNPDEDDDITTTDTEADADGHREPSEDDETIDDVGDDESDDEETVDEVADDSEDEGFQLYVSDDEIAQMDDKLGLSDDATESEQTSDEDESSGEDDVGDEEPSTSAADESVSEVPEERTEERASNGHGSQETSIAQTMGQRLNNADKVVMLIDSERFLGYDVIKGDKGVQARELKAIAEGITADVILAASKADYLFDYHKYDYNSYPHEDGDVTYKQFKQDVTEWFTQQNRPVQALASVTDSPIYPLYFVTKEVQKDGEESEDDVTLRKPVPDENGHIQPVGYEELLDEVCEG